MLDASNENKFGNNDRLSFKLLTGLSLVGALETSYLSAAKFTSNTVAGICSGESCNNALSGPYASLPILNIPLSLLGCIAYCVIAFLSFNELLSFTLSSASPSPNNDTNSISSNENTKEILLAFTTAMATFSIYLLSILTFILHTTCLYCSLSAFLSFSLAATCWSSHFITNKTKSTVIITTSSLITSLSSVFIFYLISTLNPTGAQASTAAAGQYLASQSLSESITTLAPPDITTHSSPQALKVAKELDIHHAKMYGAYWCSHCYNQKQILGMEAVKSYQYIECDKKGFNSEYNLCKEKNLKGYPTWQFDEQLYPGEKSVKELASVILRLEKTK